MKINFFSILFLVLSLTGFSQSSSSYTLKVLGVAQDGGVPHLGCEKKCCTNILNPRYVSSIMVFNDYNQDSYLFDASPNISEQLNFMKNKISTHLKGVFLTHAHIGHYTGLMFFGREAMNSKSINVYAMPRMKKFLETNGPWSQLVDLKNINLIQLHNESIFSLDEELKVTPFEVPHRDEFSETVGYLIKGPLKSALYIPDIDKWYKWETSIIDKIKEVDYALVDATFYDEKEINYRDISEIPHPFVIESLELFKNLKLKEKRKIYFIHLNHTNPLLNSDSEEYKNVVSKGFNVANEGLELKL